MSLLLDLGTAFVLGLLTPLTAACVLTLYPAFLSYLSDQMKGEEDRKAIFLFGLLVVSGVISFMMLVGILFTTVLEVSLTTAVEWISPVAFAILALIGLFLLLDLNVSDRIPRHDSPDTDNPFVNAFGFGFFFGAIVLPCNPAFIAAFFARTLLIETPATNMLSFIVFGLGIGFPLLVFAALSSQWSQKIIGTLNHHSSNINRFTGAIILVISVYYLDVVFNVFTIPVLSEMLAVIGEGIVDWTSGLTELFDSEAVE